MYQTGVRPSYSTGFAQWPGMSEYSQLWTGLMGAWDASLGQTGKRLIDWSGNGLNGTFAGGTSWTAGKYGSAIKTNPATSDYITIGDYDILSFVGDKPFSIVASVYCNALVNAGIVTKASSLTEGEYQIYMTSGGILYFICNDNSEETYIAIRKTEAIAAGGQYHIICTYDGSGTSAGMKIYINGVDSGATDTSSGVYAGMENTAEAFQIGQRGGLEWNGLIDFVSLYNRDLIPAEIFLLYQLRKQMA